MLASSFGAPSAPRTKHIVWFEQFPTLVSRVCCITARSWEPCWQARVASPLSVGSLAGKSLLRCRSLFRVLVPRDAYVAARSWEPWW
eukprot:4874631-Pyramimonas_sp.AAC.1